MRGGMGLGTEGLDSAVEIDRRLGVVPEGPALMALIPVASGGDLGSGDDARNSATGELRIGWKHWIAARVGGLQDIICSVGEKVAKVVEHDVRDEGKVFRRVVASRRNSGCRWSVSYPRAVRVGCNRRQRFSAMPMLMVGSVIPLAAPRMTLLSSNATVTEPVKRAARSELIAGTASVRIRLRRQSPSACRNGQSRGGWAYA